MFFASRTIVGEAKRRRIRQLLHSTHLYKNFPLVLSDGMLHSARELQKRYGSSASRFLHDPRRYEQFTVGLDYINASLSFPNCELLYHRSHTDWKYEWIHLSLRLDLLNRPDTLFCPVSAATNYGKLVQGGREGFAAMFADEVTGHTRSGIPHDVPTHPQAEILIRGPLELSVVKAIIVPDATLALEIERLCERNNHKIPVEVLPQFFVWPKWLVKKRGTMNDE